MAKPENDENNPEKQTWSTWEELLLACAVHRHGIDSWDSVAAEIQKHNSAFRTLTAFECRHKYRDLKRRFSRNKLASPGSPEEETVAAEISSVPWLEELRKLRVDELRREVERYDLSISSLQLKVKRLEDEREKSLKETEKEIENSDLDKIGETKESHRESGINSGVPVAETVNSPDPKDNSRETGSDQKIAEPVDEELNRNGGEDNDEKPVREDSCRGSCESVEKETAANSDRADPVREGNDSPEIVESIDESKGEKETSDVQSSASLPRKDTVEQDQPDNEDQSLTVNRIPVESQPLIDFIEILHSHPIGSHFSRRLESQLQETPEYDRIIRQHIDFEMIQSRVEEGYYKSSMSKFFRDLLLLTNNARVFYGERSSEFNAANQLNQLIKKQMTLKTPKQSSPPKDESLVTSKEEVTFSALKPTISAPIIACRKRSSLAVRSSASVTEPFKKKTKIVPTVDEKPVSSEEEEDETSDKDEEPIVSKKITRGRTPSTAKKVGSKNAKTSSNADVPSKGRTSNDSSEPRRSVQEKKSNNKSGGSKKQSAASFLKRMKGVSSSETVIETMKADSSNGKRGAEQRKSNSKTDKVDAAKPPAGQKRLTGKKPTIEKGSPVKKNTGAASKRGTAPSSPLKAKRDSETSEKETGSSTRPKKRSRR
ncbi:hypothetical protein V5N11_019169 [Cardamine amara subsp. amara]|uniref:DNA-binding bromodomain-containing protein n=1 Tax=Cardamine amara subsp. amara TaxID=228776 RepID=A0ABD0ZS88_CARAN